MNFDDEWGILRNRIRLFRIVCFSSTPGLILSWFALNHISTSLANRAMPWIFAAWGVAFTATAVYRRMFRCPRCKDWYFTKPWGFHGAYARQCGHCGLRKWSQLEQNPNSVVEPSQ
jgi:hypothetical protein